MPEKQKDDDSNVSDKSKDNVSFFKKYEFIICLTLFIIFIAVLILFFGEKIVLANACGDSTPYGSCSITRPYYCDSGFLVEKASICGCSNLSQANGDSCINNFQTESKNISLRYLLDGEEYFLGFTTYGGLVNNLANESRVISYKIGQEPVRADFEFKILNNEQQRELLLPLVVAIQNQTKDKTDQARIAISLVQNIEYGFSNKTINFFGQKVNYSRYPYEVLYDNQGICGEKSELLVFLLRELGYGTALFYNQQEDHQSVGIKCPEEESYKDTGFCFVETTAQSIISDGSIIYVDGVILQSEPEVIKISEGKSLPLNLPEYRDAKILKTIRQGKPLLFRELEFSRLQKKYGLVEEYNLA